VKAVATVVLLLDRPSRGRRRRDTLTRDLRELPIHFGVASILITI